MLWRVFEVEYHITKLQSRQTGRAGLRFKQLLCGRPHWGAGKINNEKTISVHSRRVDIFRNADNANDIVLFVSLSDGAGISV